jgi:hypothetical protein
VPTRRFPPPWSVDELEACFVVKDSAGKKLAFVYFEDEPGHRSAAKLLSKDEAQRIAANIVNLLRAATSGPFFCSPASHARLSDGASRVRKPVRLSLSKFCDTACDRLTGKSLWLDSFAEIVPRTCSLAQCIAPNAGYSAQTQSW